MNREDYDNLIETWFCDCTRGGTRYKRRELEITVLAT